MTAAKTRSPGVAAPAKNAELNSNRYGGWPTALAGATGGGLPYPWFELDLGQISPPAQPGEVNYALDRYTVMHGAAGVLLAYTPLPWYGALAISAAFEVLEPVIQDIFWEWRMTDTRETWRNILLDILAVMGGFLATRKLALRADLGALI